MFITKEQASNCPFFCCKKKKILIFHLFLEDQSRDQYLLEAKIPLKEIKVENHVLENYENCFKISSETKEYILKANSQEAKKEWMLSFLGIE